MKLQELQEFSGMDIDIQTAFIEYGLIWKQTNKNRSKSKEEYKFIYITKKENNKIYYDYGYFTRKEWENLCGEEWFDLKKVCSFSGQTKKEFIANFPENMFHAIAYHGIENIFGSSYYENDYIEIDE